MENKEKWSLAEELITAKKAVDSIKYISLCYEKLYNVESTIEEKRSNFYICICDLLDKTICKNKKKEMCKKYNYIDTLYYERDKKYAHKDSSYIQHYPYTNLEKEICYYEETLKEIKEKCKEYLPNKLTLDFVPYDGIIYRSVEKISKSEAEIIIQNKPNIRQYENNRLNAYLKRNNINTVEDIEEGLTYYEGLQKRQDQCIELNIQYDTDIWCYFDYNKYKVIEEFMNSGIIDQFGIINYNRLKWLLRNIPRENNEKSFFYR